MYLMGMNERWKEGKRVSCISLLQLDGEIMTVGSGAIGLINSIATLMIVLFGGLQMC